MEKQSILVGSMEFCMVCGKPHPHKHHVFGASNRKWSEKYKLTVPLCYVHHNGSADGVHFDKEFDTKLKEYAQERFQEEYPELDFVAIFGRNYIEKRR